MKKNRKNPSSIDFGKYAPIPNKVLKTAKDKNRFSRIMKRVWEAKTFPDRFDTDFPTCWMCWNDLSGKWLEDWRKEPFSEMKEHEEKCPLCGYPHWKGRVWYPFRFLRNYSGNPSRRNGFK